jgi:hypothetical protein
VLSQWRKASELPRWAIASLSRKRNCSAERLAGDAGLTCLGASSAVFADCSNIEFSNEKIPHRPYIVRTYQQRHAFVQNNFQESEPR